MDKTEQLAEMVIQAVQFYFDKKVEPILKELAAVKQDLLDTKCGTVSISDMAILHTKLQAVEARPVAVAVDPATIAAEVSRQIALVPPPADGKSVDLGAIFSEIGSAVTRAVDAIPRAVDGKDGANGKDGENGKDGADGKDGKDGLDGPSFGEVTSRIDRAIALLPKPVDGVNGKDGERGQDGVNGKDGNDGINGKDGDPGERGADGINGKDGKDAVLDNESVRRDIALEVHRELATWERPKDGLGIEDMSAELREDGRTLVLGFSNSAMHTEREILIPWQIYRGLWEAGRKYQKGDVVTYGGSQFTAKVDTDQAPKTDDWLLSVKRG